MSALLRPAERVAAGALAVALFVPPVLARLDGTERWMLDWFALAAGLLLAALTGLRRSEPAAAAVSVDPSADAAPADPSPGARTAGKVPGIFRVFTWIARIGAGLFAALILLQTLSATLDRRWDSLSAPLVLLAVLALYCAVRGENLLEGGADEALAGTLSRRP